MKRLLRISLFFPVIAVAVASITLATTAPHAPPPIAAIQSVSEAMGRFSRAQPEPRFFSARDGSKLSYRLYAGQPGGGVVVAVHGSSGNTTAMHGIADTLSHKGITVYSIDLRGHGLSKGPDGRLGDVAYRGQYEDDLADVAKLVKREHPGEHSILLGHSTGGSVILRTASIPAFASNFDGFLALSPFIEPGGAMDRPNQGGWTSVSVPRIIILSILNGFGISALDHMTVLAMAVPDKDRNKRPRTYSHALLASANLPYDWKHSIAAIRAPTEILIGANDELFVAQAYPEEIGRVNSRIRVNVLPGITHMGMVTDDRAYSAIVQAVTKMLAIERRAGATNSGKRSAP